MVAPAAVRLPRASRGHSPLGFSRLIACQSKPFVFCIFRTLFKSPYPSHSIGLTASSAQNVISSLFKRLRTLSKTGSPAKSVESILCAHFAKNTGGRGTAFKQNTSVRLRPSVVPPRSVQRFQRTPIGAPTTPNISVTSTLFPACPELLGVATARLRRRALPPSTPYFSQEYHSMGLSCWGSAKNIILKELRKIPENLAPRQEPGSSPTLTKASGCGGGKAASSRRTPKRFQRPATKGERGGYCTVTWRVTV